MAKITLPTIASGFASNTEFNTAFDAVEAEFQNKVLYRNNTSGETNTMSNALDMNSNAINNAAGITCTTITVDGTDLTAKVTAAGSSATAASTSAAAAAVSASSAAASASTTVAAAAGIKWKNSVKCATTANITLAADSQTLDGIGASAGSRILVKDQTDRSQNGIYVVPTGSGAWTRATDLNVFDHFPSAAVLIEQGGTHGDTAFICVTDQGGSMSSNFDWEPFGLVTATSTSGLNVSGTAISIVPVNATAAAFATDRGGADTLLFADASNSNVLRKSTVAELAAALPVTTVAGGGTGAATFTDGALMIGNGTGAMEAVDLSDGHIAVGASGTGNPTSESLTATVRSYSKAQRGTLATLSSSSNATAVDLSAGNNFTLTLSENSTLSIPTNAVAGQSGSILITQDGTGSRTLSYAAPYHFAGGTAPTLSTAGSSVDRLDYFISTTGNGGSTSKIHCVLTKALATSS